jgi:predicted NAD-dependent protein-ADP-ribosyltransferase YbiA (DUF1768 family)
MWPLCFQGTQFYAANLLPYTVGFSNLKMWPLCFQGTQFYAANLLPYTVGFSNLKMWPLCFQGTQFYAANLLPYTAYKLRKASAQNFQTIFRSDLIRITSKVFVKCKFNTNNCVSKVVNVAVA